jgi:hypothetical protein
MGLRCLKIFVHQRRDVKKNSQNKLDIFLLIDHLSLSLSLSLSFFLSFSGVGANLTILFELEKLGRGFSGTLSVAVKNGAIWQDCGGASTGAASTSGISQRRGPDDSLLGFSFQR